MVAQLSLVVLICCAGSPLRVGSGFRSRDPLRFSTGFPEAAADIFIWAKRSGVATNSKGHIFVYTRTGGTTVTLGGSRTFMHSGSQLFEFDQTGKYVREIGKDLYAFNFAHAVRVDSHDNIWIVDEGSDMVVEFNPEGRVIMNVDRKDEAVPVPAPPAIALARPEPRAPPVGTGAPYTFNSRPTWPGMPRAIFSSRMAMGIRGSRSTTRKRGSSKRGGRRELRLANSTRRTRS